MWLVEEMGAPKFRQTVSQYIGYDLKPGKHITVSLLRIFSANMLRLCMYMLEHVCVWTTSNLLSQ